jgi:Ser/Thr protein kinase RdoA (MazF antagonist)
MADLVVERWENDPDTLRFVRASANIVCRFKSSEVDRFLRFAAGAERPREMIEGEVDLLEWLAQAGVAVSRPVASKSGNLFETVESSLGTFHSVAFDRLPGTHLKIDDATAYSLC